MLELTIDYLKHILRACAGEDDSAGLDGDILNRTFEDLGYDSLALLETASRIEREFGITLEDEAMAGAETPAEVISLVNDQIRAAA